ncbi:putative nucleotidyltransferase [Bacillus mesophilus]|uniref:nucleotidyltransferase domain-containing protein n=1 Tax=Bacillus mesophilus TaxID=1808955 RepID=UPI001EF8EDEB|nr:nucleotidyltransferase domain-containing protein [Bacillus mesophilus]MBM7662980.1 putative nucleotidyltransferase [Bacillus mesophilus]
MEDFLTGKENSVEVAKKFITEYFPTSHAALLAGSVVSGKVTHTSDLDIIVFDQSVESSYRESLIFHEWNIEVFVHNLTSYKLFFTKDIERARPTLPNMVSEGIILKNSEFIKLLKMEAEELLERGPKSWSEDTIKLKQYFISDTLDDLIGCKNRNEELFIVQNLVDLLCEFILRTNNKWVGTSKWTYRCLEQYDEDIAKSLVQAQESFYRNESKNELIEVVDSVLNPFGGRLFDGFTLGKTKKPNNLKSLKIIIHPESKNIFF